MGVCALSMLLRKFKPSHFNLSMEELNEKYHGLPWKYYEAWRMVAKSNQASFLKSPSGIDIVIHEGKCSHKRHSSTLKDLVASDLGLFHLNEIKEFISELNKYMHEYEQLIAV